MEQIFSNNISIAKSRWFDKFSLHRKDTLILIMMFIASMIVPLIIIANNGNVVFAIGFLVIVSIVFITFYNLEWGFYIFITLVFAADGYDIAGLRPFTYIIFYLLTFNVIFKGMGVGVLTPMETHLIFLLFVWVVVKIVKKDTKIYPVPLWGPGVLCFAWLAFSVIYGKSKGGDPMMALWEVRALSYFAILFFFVPQVVRSKKQITNIMWIMIWVIVFKAFQGIQRFVSFGFDFGGKRTLTNHEDPLFIITLFLLLLGLITYGGHLKQKKVLAYLTFPLLWGFYIANRRATYAAFTAGIIVLILLMSKEKRRQITKYLIVFGIILAIYTAAFWNSYGRLAMVANAVKSTYLSATGQKELLSYADYTSGLARDQENYNLSVTFKKSPILGIGFGNKHEWVIMNYGEFALKGYITHNEILWLITKSGAIGFFLFFLFINCIVFRGAFVQSKLKDPYLRAVCTVCVLIVFGQIVVSYVDMQLTFSRNMVHLGLFTGLIPVIERIDKTLNEDTSKSESKN
jgi:hypothetical protein